MELQICFTLLLAECQRLRRHVERVYGDSDCNVCLRLMTSARFASFPEVESQPRFGIIVESSGIAGGSWFCEADTPDDLRRAINAWVSLLPDAVCAKPFRFGDGLHGEARKHTDDVTLRNLGAV